MAKMGSGSIAFSCVLLALLGCGADPDGGMLAAPANGAAESPATAGSPAAPGSAGSDGAINVGADSGAADPPLGLEDGGSTDADPGTGPFPPISDFAVAGPYECMTVVNVGPNSTYTVYRPPELSPGGAKHPIVGWMSGSATSHTLYTLLPHLATHGFVVVASNTIPSGASDATLGAEIIAGIDWAIAENERMGSDFFEKLDTEKLASMGYSMGSLATFMIAHDPRLTTPRLTTTVHISGGNMAPERVNNLHAPAAFICGTPGGATCDLLSGDCDLAAANCDLDFMNAKTPVFYANFTGGHIGILTPPLRDAIGAMATAWLRYKLMSDRTLEPMFVGDSCGYCQDAAWKVQQKNLP